MTTISTDKAGGLSIEDEQAIRHLVEQADAAQSDAAILPGLHLPQAIIVNLAGRRVLGRDAIGAAMSAALASELSKVLTSVEILDIRAVAPDVALVSCVKTIHDNRPEAEAASALPLTGVLTYVAVKGPDGWRIALAQTTPIQ